MIKYKDEYLPIEIGSTSLIGTGTKRPVSWGNYFSLSSGQRILNMWAENLEDAAERFIKDGLVKVRNYGKCAIIIDDRIPPEYYYNKCCFTGHGDGISIEIAKDIYSVLGDPTNELLQFIDPKEYHTIRGGSYKVLPDGSAMVSYTIKPGKNKLDNKWKMEVSDKIVNGYSF